MSEYSEIPHYVQFMQIQNVQVNKRESALWQRLSVTLLAVRTGSLQDEITAQTAAEYTQS